MTWRTDAKRDDTCPLDGILDFSSLPRAPTDRWWGKRDTAARGKYSAPECGSDNAAARLGDLQGEVLAQLPRQANERLVYECSTRN